MIYSAVKSFLHRVMPKLTFVPSYAIDNDLEQAVKYLVKAVEWVYAMAVSRSEGSCHGRPAVCPFQFDICLAVGQPKELTFVSPLDENTDDDDEEEEKESYNQIGNITDRLDHLDANTMGYTTDQRLFVRLCEKLFEKLDRHDHGQSGYDTYSVKNKRFISILDLRVVVRDDDHDEVPEDTFNVFFYLPPKVDGYIPQNVVPEWYFASTKKFLLPGPNDLYEGSIGADSDCGGSLLTFSIHAKRGDAIKVYLFYNGECIRFMPEDIFIILPLLFNMKYRSGWIQSKEAEKYDQRLKEYLEDTDFAAFREQNFH